MCKWNTQKICKLATTKTDIESTQYDFNLVKPFYQFHILDFIQVK